MEYKITTENGAAFVESIQMPINNPRFLRKIADELEAAQARIEAAKLRQCPTCHGRGSGMMNVQERDQGSGWVLPVQREVQCLRCSGTGKIPV